VTTGTAIAAPSWGILLSPDGGPEQLNDEVRDSGGALYVEVHLEADHGIGPHRRRLPTKALHANLESHREALYVRVRRTESQELPGVNAGPGVRIKRSDPERDRAPLQI
jgi:hypothetical protein